MLSLNLQRSPRRTSPILPPQSTPASRLQRSASVPKLLQPPPLTDPPPSPTTRTRGLLHKAGPKHHTIRIDVPYPLSYDKTILNCDALDHAAIRRLCGSCSWVDFTDRSPPTRCLDLGCGPGAWILEAAKEWPDCEFIGFDLVDLQVPPHRLGDALGKRIKWVHGNFLQPLPFEDGYFDHVHIRQIARGVPENNWDDIIAEVVRVLKVGGSVEIFEEDIIFPVLPRSATATPRQRQRKRSTIHRPPSGRSSSVTKQLSPASLPAHDHAVLETLFYRVFERRFINLQPTALIMGIMDVHLRLVTGSPLLNFPLPPPVSSPPDQTEDMSESRSPTPRVLEYQSAHRCTYGHHFHALDNSRSSTPVPEKRCGDDDDSMASSSRSPTLRFGSGISTPATSITEFEDPTDGPIAFYSDSGPASISSKAKGKSKDLFRSMPEERLQATAGTLGLSLYRSWQGVMACQEAIWDEYLEAIQQKDPLLEQLEWEEHEAMFTDRQKFETLVQRYQNDMETRYSIADALVSDLHWDAPRRDVNKEDEETRRAIAEARRDALRLERSGIGAVPEASRVCRKARIFVASKGAVFGIE